MLYKPHILDALAAAHPLRGRVLNAGCGEGSYCPWLEAFDGITRIDNVDVSIASSFRAHHPDPRHYQETASLTALPFADASFDAALCTEVIEHIEDHQQAVAELARVLKPGGMLIASVPMTPAPFDPAHARQGYAVDEFTQLLAASGLVVEAHRTCCHALLRGVMHYWRRPLVRVGANHTPYIPAFAMASIATLDRVLRLGKPWDVVVRARKH